LRGRVGEGGMGRKVEGGVTYPGFKVKGFRFNEDKQSNP
jgi:hypothetical protein